MRKLLAALLLLPTLVCAEEFWVTRDGAGAQDGTSLANAWPQDGIVWGVSAGQVGRGDTLYVCGTTAAPITTMIQLDTLGAFDGTADSAADIVTISGQADKCGGVQGVIDVADNHGIHAVGKPGVVMRDMTCLGSGAVRNCFNVYLGSTSPCTAANGFYCVHQYNLTCRDSGAHCAAIGAQAATNFPAASVTGIRQYNITSYDAQGAGCLIGLNADGAIQDGCTSYRDIQSLNSWGVYQRGITLNCGAANGGAGVTWTVVSGFVVKANQASCGASISTVIDVYMPNTEVGVPGRLTLDAACTDDASCGSNLAAGEYGVVGDAVYINIGKVPSATAAVYLTYAWNTNTTIQNSRAYSPGGAFDGVGIGCDFGIDGCTIKQSYVEYSPGVGITCGGGSRNCKIISSIVRNSRGPASFGVHHETELRNVSAAGNPYLARVIILNGESATISESVSSNATAIIFVQRNEGTVTQTNNFTGDPKFVGGLVPPSFEGFALLPESSLRGAGTCYLSSGCVYPDFRGYRPRIPPDIGAFQRQ